MDYKEKRREKIARLLPVKKGSGLLNNLINNLPFEAHLPGGYQYAGPGTRLDLKLERNVKPKNKLDEAAMHHDIAYSKSKKLDDRHVADQKLENEAWKRVLADDSNLAEKANAWLVTNAMKVKRAIGAGVYIKHPVNLSTEQSRLIATTTKPVTLKINKGRTKDSVMNETYLPLTKNQIKRIKNDQPIKLTLKQIKRVKVGGFLPALLAAAPAVAAVGSLISSAVNTYNNKKANDKLVEERIRHNKALEGKGIYLNKKPKDGTGIYLNKTPRTGNGLYDEYIKKKRSR